ncbi:septal ring lytic transglycosylase RlpA family protein [Deinococcus ruber]|uniref:Probable endolytic peptidoglycan transglycosylase RlpA n=1 Tax=Deinococcus ruber TaxID=1848197 RepID=A0A918BW61_9DEIO|nr:septal ring lytic transglycosylase RlpA family protein [Deinococcus ruber]GGQ93720.1 hypothetical protein GCM10008957_02280 [Deinococcus ruber]
MKGPTSPGLMLAALLAFSAYGNVGADVVYRVQPGDTLSLLARRSGVSVAELQRLNGMNGVLLMVGQAIKLPGSSDDASPTDAGSADSAAAVKAITAQADAPVFQSGMAVYYGGRADNRTVLTAAHLSLPFGTWVEVTHVRTGKSVLVLINDRGPFGRPDRIIDLSAAAARELGIMGEGVAPVTIRIARQP